MIVDLLVTDLGVWRCIWLVWVVVLLVVATFWSGLGFAAVGLLFRVLGIVCVVGFAVCVCFAGLLGVPRIDLVGLATLVGFGCSF